jgi:hypothetical protein
VGSIPIHLRHFCLELLEEDRCMWGIVRRALLPLLVLSVGVAVLVHGVQQHTAHVFVEKEIEIDLVPPGFANPGMPPGFGGPPGLGGAPGFPGPPGGMPAFGAPPPSQKLKQKVLVGNDEPETAIVRDVTIGGLVLLSSGELKRTYTGAPPSLCPT